MQEALCRTDIEVKKNDFLLQDIGLFILSTRGVAVIMADYML
jgi:hypothetical protein